MLFIVIVQLPDTNTRAVWSVVSHKPEQGTTAMLKLRLTPDQLFCGTHHATLCFCKAQQSGSSRFVCVAVVLASRLARGERMVRGVVVRGCVGAVCCVRGRAGTARA